MTAYVFISHSSSDRIWVEWIASQARALGVQPYLAEHDAHPGGRLADKIEAAVRRSDALIVLLTKSAIDSRYVQQEIGYAKALGKVVVPLVHPDVASQSLAMLDGIEYIPFDFATPPSGSSDLIGALEGIRQRAQAQDVVQGLLVAGLVVVLVAMAVQLVHAAEFT
jgi:hypothetical protein